MGGSFWQSSARQRDTNDRLLLSARTFAAGLIAILLLGAALRFSFPTADPPWRTTVGVVWHDEGA